MSKIRDAAGAIAPGSWKETFVWAAKVGVGTFLTLVGVDELLNTDLAAEQAGLMAAAAAAGNVVINRILVWAAPSS